MARVLLQVGSLDVTASGSLVGAAEAGALLVREVNRKFASAFETRQYLHGQMEAAAPGSSHSHHWSR
jgi:glucosamine--fructose-6-phosphate aminotransferase (isomerizing)